MNCNQRYKLYTLLGLLGITVYGLCVTPPDCHNNPVATVKSDASTKSPVIIIDNPAELAKQIKDNERVIIDVHAKWCGPCKAFAPLFDEFAIKHPEITCLKVDGERVPSVKTRYKDKNNSYPTFLLIKNGKTIEQFSGSSKSVERFEERAQALLDTPAKQVQTKQPTEQPVLQSETNGQVVAVSSLEELEGHIAANSGIIIDVYAQWCTPCKAFAPHYEEFAKKHPEIKCLKVDGDKAPQIRDKHKVTAYPTFIFIKDGIKVKQFPGAPQSAQELEKTAKTLLG